MMGTMASMTTMVLAEVLDIGGGRLDPGLSIESSFMTFAGDSLAGIVGVINRQVEDGLGRIDGIGDGFLKFVDELISFSRAIGEDRLWSRTGFNGNLAHHLVLWENEGGGEGHKGQDGEELHVCWW